MVAKGAGEQKPTQAAIAEALSLGHLAPEAAWASTGVASGGWLVAVPKAPAGSAGGSECGCLLRTPPPTCPPSPLPPRSSPLSLLYIAITMRNPFAAGDIYLAVAALSTAFQSLRTREARTGGSGRGVLRIAHG